MFTLWRLLFRVHVVSPVTVWGHLSLTLDCREFSYCFPTVFTVFHSSSGRHPNFAALNRGHHLYLAGRPSRWALAHILVQHVMWLSHSLTPGLKPTSFTNLSHHRLSSGFRTDSMDFLAGEFLQFFMVALQNRADHYIFILWFLSSSSASSIFFYGRPM